MIRDILLGFIALIGAGALLLLSAAVLCGMRAFFALRRIRQGEVVVISADPNFDPANSQIFQDFKANTINFIRFMISFAIMALLGVALAGVAHLAGVKISL